MSSSLQARATFATLKTYVYIALYPGEVLHVGTVNVGEVDQVEVGGLPGGLPFGGLDGPPP